MLNFIRKAFRILFVISLWLIPILFTIGGAVGGAIGGQYVGSFLKYTIGSSPFLGGFLGAISGLIAGFLFDIFYGGLIATFLNIDENLEILKDKALRIGSSSFVNSSETNVSDVSPINPVVNSGETWVCKKCGESNPVSSSTCKGCGDYR